MRTLKGAGSIDSIREIWWDVRPHPGYGTVEIRICDSIPNLKDITDLAALIQALVVGLCNHYENGTQLPYLDSWIIYENKWRATRYGMDAKLITNADCDQVSIKSIIKSTIKALEPEINVLNIGESMDRIIDRIDNRDPYYSEQINIYKETNSFVDVIKNNIEQLKI